MSGEHTLDQARGLQPPGVRDDTPDIATTSASLTLAAPGIHITGMNSALKRPPMVSAEAKAPTKEVVGQDVTVQEAQTK